MKFPYVVEKKNKKCPWHFENARDKSQKTEKCPWHVPVTSVPVTFPKCPWQFSKKCPWHRKNARDKYQKMNVTGIKKSHGEKKNTAYPHRLEHRAPKTKIHCPRGSRHGGGVGGCFSKFKSLRNFLIDLSLVFFVQFLVKFYYYYFSYKLKSWYLRYCL